MPTSRGHIPNILSISRIPASALFVVVFSTAVLWAFWIALAIAFVALLTDFADGVLARRWGVVSEAGYFLDGLGDKCFTIAICLVISRELPILVLPMWALISRELLLYGLRAIDRSKEANIARFRNLSLWQAFSIRVMFGVFFLVSGMKLYTVQIPGELVGIMYLTTASAVAFGWASVFLLAQALTK